MTRFWDGRTDRRTDGRTDGRSDCTPRPAFVFGDAGKNLADHIIKCCELFLHSLELAPLDVSSASLSGKKQAR